MNEGLDLAVVLPEVGEKPSKPYRTSPYTVQQYCALPYAQRRRVDAACDAGLAYTTYADETSDKPYTVGRRTTCLPPSSSLSTMFLADVSPAGLLELATPEVAEQTSPEDDLPNRSSSSAESAALDGPACAYPGHGPDFNALAAATTQAAVPTHPAAPLALPGTVYQTTDYDQFHLLPENRPVDPAHVRKLVAQIGARNLLHTQPLDVTADLGIIDGQHRLAAARELGLPVYYKIGEQLSGADITALNVARKNWQGADYLHYWTVKGRTDYVALTAFMQRHPTLSFSNAKMMLGVTNKGAAEEFRLGHWKAGEAYKAEQVASLVERITAEVRTFKQSAHTGFVAALHHCVTSVDGFDAKELMRTILNQPLSLVPCAGHKQWLEMLGKLYNYRKNAENHLRFE